MATNITKTSLPIAEDVEFDNSTNGFIADNTQAAIEEIKTDFQSSATPGFFFTKVGNVSNNTWLYAGTVPSNKSGNPILVNDAKLKKVSFRSELPSTYELEVYEHDGTTYTLITTVSIVSARSGDILIADLSLTTGLDLAVKLVNGSAKNMNCACIITGVL